MNEKCPNCKTVGTTHIDGVANNLGVEEWDCHNENCRVSLYYVETETTEKADVNESKEDT